MALFNITVNEVINQAPISVGNNSLNISFQDYTFTLNNFTETTPAYTDPENDAVESVKILSLPAEGVLKLGINNVQINDIIGVNLINAGGLMYDVNQANDTGYSVNFSFTLSDVGSHTFSLSTGVMTLNVDAKANLAPTIGDGTASTTINETLVFTRAMFTTNTVPPYNDPEGDLPLKLKITSLPIIGTINLNNQPITINQIINFSDIDLGLLTYVSNSVGNLSFNFEISDAGSQQFSS